MDPAPFDVLQVGYGPVGEALALMLGRQGRSVAVCERWSTRYPLPRAVCLDHELTRVLLANGMGEDLQGIAQPGPLYQWFNADWQELLVIDWSIASVSGGPEVNFVHQPTLEIALDKSVLRQPSVELFLGWDVTAIVQDRDLVYVDLCEAGTGATRRLSARYVIGCDGANSVVRNAIGSPQHDRGFEADWLVIDVFLKDGVTIDRLGIPAAGQYCNPLRPTTIVPAGIRDGKVFRRWEFMRLPGEQVEDLEREDKVWDLLRPWAGPDHIELVRHKVYRFRSLIADRWRDRRLLIAGDAAHVMPPFMGQGMCSGLRDAWNLAWKLALVLDGKADDALLDTYQSERMPHISQITDLAIYLGKIICVSDSQAAAARDDEFLSGRAAPPPPFPCLSDGLLHRADGQVQDGAGLLSPHVTLQGRDRTARLDEWAPSGSGFVVIARGFDPQAKLDAEQLAFFKMVGTHYVILDGSDPTAVRDMDGRLDAFLDARGWSAIVVRPDFYVYGGVAEQFGFARLMQHLRDDLERAGVRSVSNAEQMEQQR